MARIYRQTFTAKGANGERITHTAKRWYIDYVGGDGKRKRVAGFTDRRATEQKAATLERGAERRRSGLRDQCADQVARPIPDHLADYATHLEANGASKRHQSEALQRLRALVQTCQFSLLTEIESTPVERYLSGLKERGRGPRTYNIHLATIRAFVRWCVKATPQRLPDDPLDTVTKMNEAEDVRRERRSLTLDEYRQLLRVAELRPLAEYGRESVKLPAPERQGRRTWTKQRLDAGNIDAAADRGREYLALKPARLAEAERKGRERRLVYAAFVNTGLRRGELQALTWGALALDAETPTFTVHAGAAKRSKTRKPVTLPLAPDLADELRAWRRERGKPQPDKRVFGSVPRRLIDRVKRDLAAAGIPYVDEAGRYLDVHALRHTTATMMAMSKVDRRTCQRFMRHSKGELTDKVYTDLRLVGLHDALDGLPGLGSGGPKQTQQRATGTLDAYPERPTPKPTRRPATAKPARPLSLLLSQKSCGKVRMPTNDDAKAANGRARCQAGDTTKRPDEHGLFPASEAGNADENETAGDRTRTGNVQLGRLVLYH